MSDFGSTPQDESSGGSGSQPPPPPSSGSDNPPPPPAAQPQSAQGQATGEYGGVGKRFLARVIDGLIVGIPLGIIFALIGDAFGLLSSLATTIIGFGYFVYFETTDGATPGKKILNMRVADAAAGGVISADASFRRNWWMLLGLISWIPVLGFLVSLASLAIVIGIAVTISGDSRNQGFHDQMANTVVLSS